MQQQISLEEAKEKAPQKIHWYNALSRSGFHLPSFNSRICTNEFLL